MKGRWAVAAGVSFVLLAILSLAESLTSGVWSIVSSPNADVARNNELNGVACISATDCWAVGDYYTANNAYQTLIEHWDGRSWTIVPSANSDPTQTNLLNGVACTSSSDCWAVGKYKAIIGAGGVSATYIDQTLVEHWDGSSWSIVTSPNSQPLVNYLLSVTCTSASDCWAVGTANDAVSGFDQTLVEHWNGTLWTVVSSANAAQHNELQAVSCVSSADCWVAGSSTGPNPGSKQTLTEHWDGNTWTIVPSPNSPTPASSIGNSLSGLKCNSASDCWASGSHDPGPGFGWQTLIEHWDGSTWSIVTSPNTSSTQNNFLFGVTCISTSSCWAFGRASNGIVEQTLVEQWNGSDWNIVPSSNTGSSQYNILWTATCAPSSACWAIGYYGNASNVHQTLIENYTMPVPLSSVTSIKMHGTAGIFGIDLTNGNETECRGGGTDGDYTLVFTFSNPLTSVNGVTVTSGTGSAVSSTIDGNDAHNYVVNLTGVTNAQTIGVSLNNVTDSAGNFSSAVVGSMKVLIGDTNGDGVVNSADIGQTKSQSGQAVSSSNFREDLNVDGVINSGDIGLVKSKSGTTLP